MYPVETPEKDRRGHKSLLCSLGVARGPWLLQHSPELSAAWDGSRCLRSPGRQWARDSHNAESSSCSDIPSQLLQDSQRVPEHPNTNQKVPVFLVFVSLHSYTAMLLSLWQSSLFSCSSFLWQAVSVLPSRSTMLDWGSLKKGSHKIRNREYYLVQFNLLFLFVFFFPAFFFNLKLAHEVFFFFFPLLQYIADNCLPTQKAEITVWIQTVNCLRFFIITEDWLCADM